MNRPNPVRCKTCGGPDDLRCTCLTVNITKISTNTRDPDARAAWLVLDLLPALHAGYYVVDRP